MNYVLSSPVAALPYQVLAYYPFWNGHLRFSKKRTVCMLALLFLFKCSCFYFLVPSGFPAQLLEVLFAAAHLAAYLCMVRLQSGKMLFVYFFLVAYIGFNRGIASFLQHRLTDSPDVSIYDYSNGLLHLAALAVTLPFTLLLFRQTCDEIANTNERYIISYYWIIPALSMSSSFLYNLKPEAVYNFSFLLSRFFLYLCVLMEYIILIRSLQAARKQTALEIQAKNDRLLADMRREQYSLLLERIHETRRARHDLRQHLALIQGYLEDGNEEALREYIRAYGQSVPDAAGNFCENYAVDTISRFYLKQAQDEGIRVDAVLPLPKELPVPEPDVCILLGNLLENALAACRRMEPSGERYIRVRGLFTPPHTLSFTVDNSFRPKTDTEKSPALNGCQDSGSPDYDRPGLGLGLSSVRTTAARFGGTAAFEQTETEFRASVLLFGKRDKTDADAPR